MKKGLLLIFATCFLFTASFADQLAYLSKADADRGAEYIEKAKKYSLIILNYSDKKEDFNFRKNLKLINKGKTLLAQVMDFVPKYEHKFPRRLIQKSTNIRFCIYKNPFVLYLLSSLNKITQPSVHRCLGGVT